MHYIINRSANALNSWLGHKNSNVQLNNQSLQHALFSRSKKALESALDSINDEILLSTWDGKITFTNARFQAGLAHKVKLLENYSVQELFDIISLKHQDSDFHNLLPLVEDLCTHPNFRIERRKIELKSPGKKIFLLTTNPIYNSQKGLMGRIWQFEDITAAENLDQLKSEFISIASHQLRTPITSIRGYLEMINNGDFGEVPSALREPLEALSIAGNQMHELIEDLLKISHLEKPANYSASRLFSLNQLLTEIITELQVAAHKKNIAFNIELTQEIRIFSNRTKIEESLSNLIQNAIKYSPENETVIITAVISNSNVIISIKDNGIGIPSEEQQKVFTKFFRATNTRLNHIEGSGLGLYYVKNALASVHGEIKFYSQENIGTTFIVTLPLHFKQ